LGKNKETQPRRVILTEDPMRAKMLSAHHLEYSALDYEQGDTIAYTGSYKETPIALASTGIGSSAVLTYINENKTLEATEIIYIGGCKSTTDKPTTNGGELRTVVLATGGSQNLLNRAIKAAKQNGIAVTTQTVKPPDMANTLENVIVCEITGALYERARNDGIEALSILTVSENTKTGEKIEEHEKQSRYYAAARLVFETLALQ